MQASTNFIDIRNIFQTEFHPSQLFPNWFSKIETKRAACTNRHSNKYTYVNNKIQSSNQPSQMKYSSKMNYEPSELFKIQNRKKYLNDLTDKSYSLSFLHILAYIWHIFNISMVCDMFNVTRLGG